MTTGKLLSIIVVIFILFAGAYFFISPIATSTLDKTLAEQTNGNSNTIITPASPQTKNKTTKEQTTTKTNTPKTNPTPVPDPTPKTTPGYTKGEVSLHSSENSCWSIVNKNVYDLTSYVSRHPGGSRNILRICGTDGTSLFEGQHGGESRPERTLEIYYIGPLK